MKLFKYLLFIALLAGITVPLLTSCSNDDDEALPIEGYWYATGGYGSNEMWLLKDGKFVWVLGYNITKTKLKEYADKAFSDKNISHNDDIEGAEYGTYLIKGNKLKMKFEGDDSGEDIVCVSFQKNKSIMVWQYEDEDDDEEGRVYLQRYTEE